MKCLYLHRTNFLTYAPSINTTFCSVCEWERAKGAVYPKVCCSMVQSPHLWFSFILYDIMFSMRKSKRGSYSNGSQCVSTPNFYVIPLLYHTLCISPGSQQLRLYNRHPCWLYVLYTLHVLLGLLSEKTLILTYPCSSRFVVAWFDHPTCGCHADILCLCVL